MTIEEIFNKIATHMLDGIMYHDSLMKAYDFIGLWGLGKCHEYHCYEEEINYREWVHYYATHCFKLIQTDKIAQPDIIPENWYKYSAQAVDVGTRRNAVKELMTKWVEWEKDTKKLYEEMYSELTNLREIAVADKVKILINDVADELSWAQKELLKFESIGYDLTLIVDWQDKMFKKFEKKLKDLF